MEDKDHLREILGSIIQIHEPIDLEEIILKSVHQQEKVNTQIARYKANGAKALIVSCLLIVVLGVLFSLPSSVQSIEYSSITYTSISLSLLVLFVQLEFGATQIFSNLKSSLS